MKKSTKKALFLLLAGVMLLAVLSACASGTETEEAPPADKGEIQETLETLSLDVFKDHDLTLVNVFATWCSPCIKEIPELEKLRENMADKGVNVIGVVMDAAETGEGVDLALALKEKTGATYPFLIPNYDLFDGRLATVTAVPETFFVDGEGNVVGETYVGARNLEAWTEIVEQTLADVCDEAAFTGFPAT